jgi:hypothetical protein
VPPGATLGAIFRLLAVRVKVMARIQQIIIAYQCGTGERGHENEYENSKQSSKQS